MGNNHGGRHHNYGLSSLWKNIYLSSYLMIMKHLLLSLLLLLCAILACSRSTNSSVMVIDFENDLQKGHEIQLSQIASSIEYLPLETTEASLLSDMLIINASDTLVFVVDRMNSANCKVFNKFGNFIRTIGQKGRGPNEFLAIRGLFCSDNQIAITDVSGKAVVFELDGTALEVINFNELIHFQVNSITSLGENRYCISWFDSSINASKLAIIEDQEILFEYTDPRHREPEYMEIVVNGKHVRSSGSPQPSMIYEHFGNIRLFSPETDTVFSFSHKFEKTPAFVLNYGKYKYLLDNSNYDASIQLASNFVYETDKYLFLAPLFPAKGFAYRNPNIRVGCAIYDKKKKSLMGLKYDRNYEYTGLINDIDKGAPFWPTAIVGDTMYQTVDAMTFIKWSKLSKSKKMKQIASTINEASNPVLVVAKLK